VPKRSPSRPDAVYRITLGVTKEERDVIKAIAHRFGKGVGELLWFWVRENVEYYAKDPLVQEWIANRVPEEPEVSAKQELTKEEVLEIIRGEND